MPLQAFLTEGKMIRSSGLRVLKSGEFSWLDVLKKEYAEKSMGFSITAPKEKNLARQTFSTGSGERRY